MNIKSLKLRGYRPFRDITFTLDKLEVIVGANASGKSSFFEFLKFLRDAIYFEIPPEIIGGSIGQQIFHQPGPEKFWWSLEIDENRPMTLYYQGELFGPVGKTHISFERVRSSKPFPSHNEPFLYMNIRERNGIISDPVDKKFIRQDIKLKRPNQLALSTINNPKMATLYNLRDFISGWRFYSSFNINNQKIRKSVPIEQEPVLHEDAGNLSSVLHYLMTEYSEAFDELQTYLSLAIPGFKSLTVKARGGPGEVIAYWQEEGVETELSLADLSDGVLRLICWFTLSVIPNPSSLICIDEPDQGVHPRTLPILAGVLKKASERTQIFLATHASYFLTQFDLEHIAVMRKSKGTAEWIKPKNSVALQETLKEFGNEEIESLHRSDELEIL